MPELAGMAALNTDVSFANIALRLRMRLLADIINGLGRSDLTAAFAFVGGIRSSRDGISISRKNKPVTSAMTDRLSTCGCSTVRILHDLVPLIQSSARTSQPRLQLVEQ